MTAQIKSKERVFEHGEVFTNTREVKAMLNMVQQEAVDINSTFLEPACGNGNFLAEILMRKLKSVEQLYRNDGIYTFKRYEDSSLEYTGIRKHALDENVGLFSTVISREDYEQMAAQQRDSMVSTTQYMPIAEKILAATQAKTVTPQKPKVQNTSSIPPKTGKVEATQKPISFTKKDSSESIESKVTEIPKITIGDKVKHKKFGVGTVTDFNGTVMDVRFDEGQKRLGYPFVFENNIIEKL